MCIRLKAKENHSKRRSCVLNATNYKLRAGKHLAYYVMGQGIEDYRVGGAHEVLDQALMLPRVRCVRETMGKKPKIMAKTGLCSSQRHCSTMKNAMKGDLPNLFRDVMQASHRYGAPGIDKSRRVIRN